MSRQLSELTDSAGHETVATAMTWALYELSRQPKLQDTLHEELQAAGVAVTMDALVNLPFLEAVVVSPDVSKADISVKPSDSIPQSLPY